MLTRFTVWMYHKVTTANPKTVGGYTREVLRHCSTFLRQPLDSPRLSALLNRLEAITDSAPKARMPLPMAAVRAYILDPSTPAVLRLTLAMASTLMLRLSDYIFPDNASDFDTYLNLTFRDIIPEAGRIVVFLGGVKNDPHNKGCRRAIATGMYDKRLDAMELYADYLTDLHAHGVAFSADSPFLLLNDGRPVKASHVNAAIRHAARLRPLECTAPIDRYSSHSLRAAGATALAAAGVSDREIKLLGRWRSDVFMAYTRLVAPAVRQATFTIMLSNAVPAFSTLR